MLRVLLHNKYERQELAQVAAPLEFGRGPPRDIPRFVVQDDYISRNQLRVDELPDGQVRLENLSERVPVVAGEKTIDPLKSSTFPLPIVVQVGQSTIELSLAKPLAASKTVSPDERLPPTVGSQLVGSEPAAKMVQSLDMGSSLAELGASPAPEKLARWFEKVIVVQRAAANSDEFYLETARALVELVGLDSGFVLLRPDKKWQVAARFGAESERDRPFSQSILNTVVQEQRTLHQDGMAPSLKESLVDVTAVVASPIFAPDNAKVLGVVYGSRFRGSKDAAARITPLEAQMVQVLASAVGAGMARLESEKEAVRQHVQFEQFFSPELAAELDRNPGLLDGREREVTVLFSDIRGFSRLAEQFEPRQTFMLVQDVMERLTQRVREQSGVVVDYIGDGLLAMWNAPADQQNHAELACRAALNMLTDLPELSKSWQTSSNTPVSIGIGINTGPALVGNTGSRQRLKYGPLGHTVNVASRLEGVTKQLGVPVLISGTTRQRVGQSFATRRLYRVRLVGIVEPVEVFELHAENAPHEWIAQRDTYEEALTLFEAGRWQEACRTVYPLLREQQGRYDIPSLTLASRALDCLKSPPANFDPVLELVRK